jgi:hypothetical protein
MKDWDRGDHALLRSAIQNTLHGNAADARLQR